MSKVYGIDLGTTYSAIATLDDSGNPEVIENHADAIPLLASAVYFPEGGDPVIGKEAKNQVEVEPERVVQFVKREIGKPDGTVREFNGEKYDPILISSLILKRMKEYAEEQGHEVNDVVITCPAYFGTEERNATRQAGIIAGLNVLNIVNEPTAAALNYCCREFQENRKIMVYDLGGGTFDITLFDMIVDDAGKSKIDIIKSDGNDRLGGVDWDNRLFEYVTELYSDETGIAVEVMDSELRQIIRSQIEEVKKSLSNLSNKSFTINYGGFSERIEVSRENFEEITKDLLTQTVDLINKMLSDTGVSPDNIDVVLLVGGSTCMPMVKSAVEEIFPGKVRVEQPNLAVAKGAALAAAVEFNETVRKAIEESGGSIDENGDIELGEDIDISKSGFTAENPPELISVPKIFSSGGEAFSDKLSRSFGPGTLDNSQNYVIDNLLFAGEASPSEATEIYGPVHDNQSAVLFRIFENMATDQENKHVMPCVDIEGNDQYTDPALKVKKIGELSLPLQTNTPAGTPIAVTFRCGTMGISVSAVNQQTGEKAETEIKFENAMSNEAVEAAKNRFATIKTKGQI